MRGSTFCACWVPTMKPRWQRHDRHVTPLRAAGLENLPRPKGAGPLPYVSPEDWKALLINE